MTNLTVFAFEAQQVRFVGTAEQPEWVAQDVCECLELSDTSKALEPLEADEKGTKIVRTLGGEQEMLTVMEPGLYRLVFKSRKPIAQRFRRWVFHEVIPSIRKTGSYSIDSSTPIAKLPSQKERLETIQLGQELRSWVEREARSSKESPNSVSNNSQLGFVPANARGTHVKF